MFYFIGRKANVNQPPDGDIFPLEEAGDQDPISHMPTEDSNSSETNPSKKTNKKKRKKKNNTKRKQRRESITSQLNTNITKDEEDDGQEGELGENEEDIGAGAETAIEIGVMSSLDRPGQDRSRSESTIASTVFDYSSTTTSTVTFNVTDEAPKSVKKPRGSRRSLGGDGTFVTPPRDPNRIVIQTRSGNKY
jgi:hypothetical protein